MSNWWEVWSERWEFEKQELARCGIKYVVDTKALAAGKAVIQLEHEINDLTLRLIVTFPTTYPYFPPMVVAPDLDLARHQTPGTKQLCLLPNGGQGWKPASDTLAGLIIEQLPSVLASQPDLGLNQEVVEVMEGEPITGFISTEDFSFVGFPSYEMAGLTNHGTFRIGIDSVKPFRGTVLDLKDTDGIVFTKSEVRSEDSYSSRRAPIVIGRWIRLEARPPAADAKAYYDLATQALASAEQPRWAELTAPMKSRIDIIALLFEDELAWRGSAGNVILISKTQEFLADGQRGKVVPRVHRAELESRDNYFVRDPSASGLQRGTVALVGAGSIGSPAAKHLSQAGVGGLRIFDQDVLDAGNAIRWELGRAWAGFPKAHALQRHIEANFPFTKAIGLHTSIGNPLIAGDSKERDVDEQLFRGVTCMFDACASILVSQYLSDAARSHKIPFVWMHATNGGWGGLVGRAGIGKEEFCWMCHMYYLQDGHIDPIAAASETNMVQPPGCMHPTFIGSQVDLVEVSLMGARRVIDELMLQAGELSTSAYDWNVATLRLRDQEGRPQLPVWTAYQLKPHESCPNH